MGNPNGDVEKCEVAEDAADIVVDEIKPGANKINAQTRYNFEGKNLTAYGGLLPVAAMLEKLGFEELVHGTVNLELRRQTRSMEWEPMLMGILRVARLPVQSAFWRFLESLHLTVAGQLGRLDARLRQRVWAAANVKLREVTLDTDTTVHTLYGSQMGGRVSYNPKNKGKRSCQPIPTFVAGTREFAAADCARVISNLPESAKKIRARADSGFYCCNAVKA